MSRGVSETTHRQNMPVCLSSSGHAPRWKQSVSPSTLRPAFMSRACARLAGTYTRPALPYYRPDSLPWALEKLEKQQSGGRVVPVSHMWTEDHTGGLALPYNFHSIPTALSLKRPRTGLVGTHLWSQHLTGRGTGFNLEHGASLVYRVSRYQTRLHQTVSK